MEYTSTLYSYSMQYAESYELVAFMWHESTVTHYFLCTRYVYNKTYIIRNIQER